METKPTKTPVELNATRRQLLLWTPPIITAVALPAHAESSVCDTPPEIVGIVPAKCIGTSPDSEGTLELRSSDAAISVEILDITHDAVDPNKITLSATSGTVTKDSGIEIKWEGPGPSGNCIPEVNVNFTVSYTCNNDPMTQTFTFNLVEEFLKIVP